MINHPIGVNQEGKRRHSRGSARVAIIRLSQTSRFGSSASTKTYPPPAVRSNQSALEDGDDATIVIVTSSPPLSSRASRGFKVPSGFGKTATMRIVPVLGSTCRSASRIFAFVRVETAVRQDQSHRVSKKPDSVAAGIG